MTDQSTAITQDPYVPAWIRLMFGLIATGYMSCVLSAMMDGRLGKGVMYVLVGLLFAAIAASGGPRQR